MMISARPNVRLYALLILTALVGLAANEVYGQAWTEIMAAYNP